MTILGANVPYPDFQLNEVIDPEHFDANNGVLVAKLNELIAVANRLTDGDGSVVKLNQTNGFTSTNLKDFLEEFLNALGGSTGSSLIGTPAIPGVVSNSLSEQLTEIANLIAVLEETLRDKIDATDVYSRDELEPYLRGGDTTIRYDVFKVTSIDVSNKRFNYTNSQGQQQTGTINASNQYVFVLQNGTYTPGTNQMKALVNDTLHRSVASGGLAEISETQVALTTAPVVNDEITFEYFERVGVSGEAGIVVSASQPTRLSSTLWYKLL